MSPSLDPLSAIVSALKGESIIPDVIPESSNFVPSVLFSIIYPSGKEAILSTELTREDAMEEPEINFTPMVASDDSAGDTTSTDGETSYTLVMTDPDAPSREDPKYRQFRHWVITGLKSPATATDGPIGTANLTALKTKASITPYRPPGPPPGSGLHRYCFLLFQEPTGGSFSIPQGAKEYGAALEERRSWNAFNFGTQYGLKLVGANYFIVRSVDI